MSKLSVNQVLESVRNSTSNRVKVAVVDVDGVLRGKYMSKEKFLQVAESDFGFCDVVFGWDCADAAYDNSTITGWHTGYPDTPAKVDLGTFRQVPWEEQTPFFLADFDIENSEFAKIDPRTLLKRLVKQAENMGLQPKFSQEFEWFNFRETPHSIYAKGFKDLEPLTLGMFGYSILRASLNREYLSDLMDSCLAFGIPLEGLHTETGPGVLEAAITYSNALEAADRAILFKTAVKKIAYQHGILPTFMAKISENLPGCSGHVHQSICDIKSEKNLFFDEQSPDKMSEQMKHYIAGQLHCLPQILPMLAPTVNSYKRLVVGAWAPTTLTWGIDNRTTAIRALPGGSKSCRIETRVVGSDTNPYLAMAACLAAGLYGIAHKLDLQPQTKGNGYLEKSFGVLSPNLFEATIKMQNSTLANELFGKEFVEHFCGSRIWEWRKFSAAVTDWETKRYLEII